MLGQIAEIVGGRGGITCLMFVAVIPLLWFAFRMRRGPHCPRCGQLNRAEARFCGRCGMSLE